MSIAYLNDISFFFKRVFNYWSTTHVICRHYVNCLLGYNCLLSADKESYWTKGSYWLTSKVIRMSPPLCQPLRYVCVTNAHVYVPRVVSIYGLVTRFVIRVTRRVALMEQELHSLLKHRSSYERYIATLFDRLYVSVAFYSHVESSCMYT